MSKNKKIQPRLRFKDDKGNDFPDWEEKVLGDIATFSKGKSISKNDIVEDGFTECIRYGELYTEYGEVIKEIKSRTNLDGKHLVFSKYNDVIIPASGETQIDISTASCVLKDDVALGGDLNIIRTDLNGVFLSYYLNNVKKLEIAKLAQGNAVVHLYASQLKTLKISVPVKEEQDKIARFLTAIDDKVQSLQKELNELKAYKKGVMQALFASADVDAERSLKVEAYQGTKKNGFFIRFRDANGNNHPAWEQRELGELMTFKNGLNAEKHQYGKGVKFINVLDIINNNCITYDKIIGSVEVSKKEFQTYEVTYGDLLFQRSSETREEVGQATVYVDVKSAVFGGFVIRGKAITEYNPAFINYQLKTDRARKEMTEKSGGSTRYNIGQEALKEVKVFLPSMEEQMRIAGFLEAIDKKIDLSAGLIANTKRIKQALLQQLFH